MKFAPGDLVRNLRTKEDGKVIEAYEDDGVAMHMVSVPKNPTGWSSGARVAYWSEDELDFSTNDLLNESLGEGRYA
ncbi:MAG: hypothetical protein WBQ68_08545 [Terriglobales bacterium]